MTRYLFALLLAVAGCGTTKVSEAPATTTPTPTTKADACIVGPRSVSSATTNGNSPYVASRRDELALVWVEAGEDHAELRLQIFDAHGEPLTGNLLVAPLTTGGEPFVVATDEGYAILWSAKRAETTAIVLQRVDARGRSIGPPVDAFTSPTAHPLAFAATRDGFVVVWWQWATQPHRQVATWLDAKGAQVSDVELTKMPCDDPMSDVRLEPDGRVLVTWEQQIEGQQHVIVGLLSKTAVLRQGSEYVGRDPALLRNGVVMTALDSSNVLFAPIGGSAAAPLTDGRMVDGAVLGNDSVMCRARHGSDDTSTGFDELLCAREKGGQLLRERSLTQSPRLGSAHIADTSFGYVVVLEGAQRTNEDVAAVQLTVVQCND